MTTADTTTTQTEEAPVLRMRADLAETFGRLVVAAAGEVGDEDLPLLADAAALVAELAEKLAHKGQPGADGRRLEKLRWAAHVAVLIHRAA